MEIEIEIDDMLLADLREVTGLQNVSDIATLALEELIEDAKRRKEAEG